MMRIRKHRIILNIILLIAESLVLSDYVTGQDIIAYSRKGDLIVNAKTTIQFKLPNPSHITLKIYNVLGEEIATIVDEYLNAGYNNANCDGKNVKGQRRVEKRRAHV